MDTDRMKPGILIFAGTTEGRSLAEYASANSVRCFVSVATDYGKSLLEKLENITLLTGRMDEKEMERFIDPAGHRRYSSFCQGGDGEYQISLRKSPCIFGQSPLCAMCETVRKESFIRTVSRDIRKGRQSGG